MGTLLVDGEVGEIVTVNVMGSQRTIQARTTEATSQKKASTFFKPLSPHSSVQPVLQFQRSIGNQAVQSLLRSGRLQAKLEVSQPGDIYEQEADRIADQRMRMPEPSLQSIQKKPCGGCTPSAPCPECAKDKKDLVQRKVEQVSDSTGASVPDNFLKDLGLGQPLEPATRDLFETRLGQDFSRVRVHTDTRAAESAHAVNALAFTIGSNIVFGAGQYRPMSTNGQQLLSHELTHVMQQSGEGRPRHLQRQLPMEPTDVPASTVIRDAPNAKTWTGAPAKCGPDFCRPLPSEGMAIDDRRTMWPLFMAGIAYMVSSRVVPLWSKWAFGGSSSVMNLTKDFGPDFGASPTTARTTGFLIDRIMAKLTASPPTIPSGGSLKLDIPTLIPADVKAIDDPSSPKQMNFNVIGDIPGNIAGGIGKDQAATPIGATPSPQNDERIAKGDVTVMDAGASLVVFPHLNYTVKDTIDLCPGDCGADKERIATISMSQWEATGISGDLPFTVDFPALSPLFLPFIIPKPAALTAPPAVPAPAPKKPQSVDYWRSEMGKISRQCKEKSGPPQHFVSKRR